MRKSRSPFILILIRDIIFIQIKIRADEKGLNFCVEDDLILRFRLKKDKVNFGKGNLCFKRDKNNIKLNIAEDEDKIKEVKKRRYLNKDKIYIVIKEIEGWYIAGFKNSKKYKSTKKYDANTLLKEDFERLIPDKKYKLDFMHEILQDFCLKTAMRQNLSFKNFIEKEKLINKNTKTVN